MLKIERIATRFNLNVIEETCKGDKVDVFQTATISQIATGEIDNALLVMNMQDNVDEHISHTSAIIICEVKELTDEIKEKALKFERPVLWTKFTKREVYSTIDAYLLRKQQKPERVHGTLLSVFGEGILITGQSGIGKSELALELVNRKHLFIGDDAIDIISFAGKAVGRTPRMSRDFLEVRGVGIINLKGMFGVQSMLKETNIDLIIELVNLDDVKSSIERLGRELKTKEISGVEIPLLQVPVSSGRSIAPVVESAVISFKQRMQDGYVAVNDLTQRLKDS